MNRRTSAIALTLIAALVLSACSGVTYQMSRRGDFTGDLFVMWLDNHNGNSGSGRFLFVPNPRNRLTFVQNTPNGPRTIRPGMMYTDGGSVPRIAQVFKGFDPWGYAPAYMVHDWLFVARQCLNDKVSRPEYEALRPLTFDDSAQIAADAIRTLIETHRVGSNDVSASLVTLAVTSPMSLSLWKKEGACESKEVTKKDRDAAERAIPGSGAFRRAQRFGIPPGAPVAQIVGTVSFD